MAETSEESIVDERQELMVSPSGDDGSPILRTAHFLKPSAETFTDEESLDPVSRSRSSLPPKFDPSEWPLNINFNGWPCRPRYWRKWVHFLRHKHQAVWKQAGIYNGIMNSTFEIKKDENVVLGISERWCPETKSFSFPWGEATITLEDVMVMGGYSVLGDSVFSPLETAQMKEIHKKLIQAQTQSGKRKSHTTNQLAWMKMFMGKGSEIEHEAFLATWLSMFVFANSNLIRKVVVPIAIHLARGTRIALAPAVLASIYKDLSLLKKTIVASTKLDRGENGNCVLELNIWSPLQLLQIWALERFTALQAQPNIIKRGDPFFGRWNRIKILKLGDVRSALDSAGKSFKWCPFTTKGVYWNGSTLYGEKAMWVPVGPGLNEQQESFARCLRVSKLVGIDCIEQYLPHRVAMQFGMDQDLPGCVAESNQTPEVAWNNFNKPIGWKKLYIPSRHFEAGVTARYMEWKKKSLDLQDAIKGIVKRPRSGRSSPEKGMKKGKVMQKASEVEINGKDLENPKSLSASIADNRAAGENKLMSKAYSRTTECKCTIKRIITSVDGLKITSNEANERNSGDQDSSGSKSERTRQRHTELEARICRLESSVAMIRAARFGKTKLV
ncbi:uncharacterized protein LOC125420646 [Ziziphus jujuba]|uniref:Uncharacterized protein LOC125420646 n=1 Tax=Ziziphus jujuba TaxID=326968 RepID=A0ABM3I8J2_ZIZJJ|nr:uncharacterized protein LOC125420646 [Ziziphus jujuba]